MGDLEDGLWPGDVTPNNNNKSITGYKYLTAFLKGDATGKNRWAIKSGNAQTGALTKTFDGKRPAGGRYYNPMRKEGAIGLGTGGDNSNSAQGNFFEGIMTAHFSSDAADDAVQANIVAAYGN
jgi:non-reducing end alpha-L-arabinofuranosidase